MISGLEFNQTYSSMYKIIKSGVGYVHGLNAVPFCEKRSGIYFTQQDKIPLD